jgi:hypothetical protein
MESELRSVGLTVDTSQTYLVPVHKDDPDLERGSVFIDSRTDIIQIYVEDRMVRSIPRGEPSSQTAAWIWNSHVQQFQYGTGTEVQHVQTQCPLNVWVYSETPWEGEQHMAFSNGTTIYYQ